MGCWAYNQTGTDLEIKNCRLIGADDPLGNSKTVPRGGRHFLSTSSLDIVQDSEDPLGSRKFQFSAGTKSIGLPLIKFKNSKSKNFKIFVFRIGYGGFLTCTPLEYTKCRVSNKATETLMIKAYFVYNVKKGLGDYGAFTAQLTPGKSMILKFSPSDINWNEKQHWEQLEFHVSIVGQVPKKLSLDDFKFFNKFVFRIGPDGGLTKTPSTKKFCQCLRL